MSDDVRTDWDERIALRTDRTAAGPVSPARRLVPDLPPPAGVTATAGIGQVTVDWDPVDGAVGYQVLRAPSEDGPFAPVDHRGGDVLAVPGPPYADTTGEVGTPAWYSVASVPEVTVTGRRSDAVPATPQPAGTEPPRVTIRVEQGMDGVDGAVGARATARPWRPMIGSERLSQLLCRDTTGGRVIGDELAAALGRVHRELGVEAVRAHAIFHDDTAVYREVDGRPVHDFTVVDQLYDRLLALGLRPVVELGFMPTDLARDPDSTVFAYRAVISPPKDYARWGDLVRALTQHLVDRYGRETVCGWEFEVWNEANLEVFWSGTKQEWFELYDVSAAAVKSVDPRIAVGGPSSAAAGWVEELLAHCRKSGAPVDFVSTHTYGSPPLDVRPSLARQGFSHARVLWTEWGVTPTHFNPVSDSVFAGVFLLRGMRSAAGRVEALSYWVASDHFEELGRPPRLLHGGFGLLTVGNLPKPRFHALAMLAALGDVELPVRLTGDGAGSLVEAWATRDADGRVAVLVWNLTLDQRLADGDPALTRAVSLDLTGLVAGPGPWRLRTTTLAAGSGDLVAAAAQLRVGDWPRNDGQWRALAAAAQLPVTEQALADASRPVELVLAMPSAVLLELLPTGPAGER